MATVAIPENVKGIDPERLYTLREAVQYIPSPHGGRTNRDTLYRWLIAGKVRGFQRKLGVNTLWFVLGADLIRLATGEAFEPAPPPKVRNGQQQRAEYGRAQK